MRAAMSNAFSRLGTYFVFLFRRERIISPIWILCLAGLSVMIAALYPSLVPGQLEMVQLATTMSNPAMVAMMGPVYGMEDLSQASVMAQECLIWFLVSAALMNIFLVNRHTRTDEELGRLEMFRALPVGRLTGALAVIKFAFLVNLVVALLSSLGLMALGVGGTTPAGAFAYGFAVGAVGLVFAALTLLGSQIFSTSHGVSGFGFLFLGLFYIMRALGDVAGNALSAASPFGLALQVEVFYSNHVLPLIVLFIEALVLTVVALAICAVRDHGAGIIPARKGKAHASAFLRSSLGFTWRLSRGTIVAWALAMFLLGASYGSVCSNIDDFVQGNGMMQQILNASGTNIILDSYVALIFMIMSLVTSVPIILMAQRIHTEERRGRLEQIFAKSVPRTRLYLDFVLLAVLQSIVLQLLLALGLAMASSGQITVASVVPISLSYLPAIWAMAGVTMLLVGFIPKLSPLVWAIFGYTFLVMYIGKIMDVPQWATRITPFGNIAQQPLEEFSLLPLIILTVIALALGTLGILRFRQRDIG